MKYLLLITILLNPFVSILFDHRFDLIFDSVMISTGIFSLLPEISPILPEILSNIKKRRRIPTQEAAKLQTDITAIIYKYLTVTNKHNTATEQLISDLQNNRISREKAEYKMDLIAQNTKRELLALSKDFQQLKKGSKLNKILTAFLKLIEIDIEKTQINQQLSKNLYEKNINKKESALNNINNQIINYLDNRGLPYEDYKHILENEYNNNLKNCYLKNI